VQRALWGFNRSEHRGDGDLGEQDCAGSTSGRATWVGWMCGKGVELLLDGGYEPGVRRNKASGIVAGR